MPTYLDELGVWACESCTAYRDENKRKVNMHEVTCKKRVASESEGIEPEPVEEEVKEPTPERSERIPFGVPTKKLTGPDDASFSYRYFNDGWAKDPGRVQRAERGGYVRVDQDPVTVGTNEDGSAIKGVLMKIPKEMYDEDQKEKRKVIDRVDEAIKGGTLEQQAGEKRYIPDGIKMWSSHNEDR